MRTGCLLGRDHALLGAVATLAERRAALALSRGGARKTYPYQDPNEDACAFAYSDAGWLVAVADGHWGERGAALAVERLLEDHASRWLGPAVDPERWEEAAYALVLDLNDTLVAAAGALPTIGRTTLSLCVVRPDDDLLLGLGVGDSHLFRVEKGRPRELFASVNEVRRCFVGDPALDASALEKGGLRAGVERGVRSGAVVLATDGLSETAIGVADPLGAAAASVAGARRAPAELRPLIAARGLARRALAAQREQRAGDNVATAVVWLDD